MQVQSPRPVMEERGGGESKLWRSSSLPPANTTLIITRGEMKLTRATSLTIRQGGGGGGARNLSTRATRPSALLERRRRGNPALKVEAFNTSTGSTTSTTSTDPPPPPPPPPPPRTPYEILQVSPSASQHDIKTAYWRSARLHHPDKVPSHLRDASTLLFLEIHSAYSTLKDPLSRARYDLQLSLQSFHSSGYQHHQSSPSSSTPYTPRSTPYTPRTPSSSSSSPYRYSPRAQPPLYSPNLFTPRAQPSYTGYTPSSPNLYTPRAQPTPGTTPRGPPPSPNYYTPRSPYTVGRSWETDQCW